jgi:hypothetical protein
LTCLILKNEGTTFLWKVKNHPTAYHHNPEDLNTSLQVILNYFLTSWQPLRCEILHLLWNLSI